jgi:maltooligosyltrehalose trehalohydrolase
MFKDTILETIGAAGVFSNTPADGCGKKDVADDRVGHAQLLEFYRGLIRLRRFEPDMSDPWLTHLRVDFDERRRWIVMRRGRIAIACNLGTEPAGVDVTGETLLQWGGPEVGVQTTTLPGHSVAVVREPMD